MNSFCSLLCVFMLMSSTVFSQIESPYSFNWKKDLGYSAGAGLVLAGGLVATSQMRPLTAAQVGSLDPFELSGIDRTAISKWNPAAGTSSDAFLYASFAFPGLMMINKRARKDFLVVGFIYAEVGMITLGLTELSKAGFHRVRPYAYNPDVDIDFKTTKGARQSFFSGHTAMTAALCFTTAKVFSDYSDNPTHEALVWTGAAIFPIVTASLRYAAGRHFPSDVITGYFIGGAIGYLVPWLHRRKPLAKGLTISPIGLQNGAGIYLSYRL